MKKFICCLLIIIGVINVIDVPKRCYVKAQDELSEMTPQNITIETNEIKTNYRPNNIKVSTTTLELKTSNFNKDNNKKEEEVRNDDNGTVACMSVGVVNNQYTGDINQYTDLSSMYNINADQMNSIIEYWLDGRESKFRNEGEAFIIAANNTGLDPIFLLALAAQESGWEVSDLHSSKNNPYSINMVDSDPNLGYTMGDKFAEGIINGATWIKDNYYNQGQTNLNLMIYGVKCYSSSTDYWINSIDSIMSASYKYLLNY